MKENKQLIDSMCKGCSMSVLALDKILERNESKISIDIRLIKDEYNKFLKEAESILQKKDSEIKGINLFQKISSGLMLDIELMHTSDEEIASMVIKGINMGLEETEKILSLYNISDEYKVLADKYINMQNKAKDRLVIYMV